MDVVDIARTEHGIDVVCDARAALADAIVVVARVKPHTDFSGTIESGLLKMSALGLGKAIGAARYHAAFARWGYELIIREVAAALYANLPIVAGLAIVEDNRGGTHAIEAFTRARSSPPAKNICSSSRGGSCRRCRSTRSTC